MLNKINDSLTDLKIGQDIQVLSELSDKSNLKSRAFFSNYEIEYCEKRKNSDLSFLGILSAKEAFIKAISGCSFKGNYSFRDIEILHHGNGRPYYQFRNQLKEWFEINGAYSELSISHTGFMASAIAVIYFNLGGARND